MRLSGSRVSRGGARALLGALTLSAAAASGAEAQQQAPRSPVVKSADGAAAHTISRRGFNLFGSGDIAVTGMKQSGQQGWALTNYGPGGADGYVYTGDFGHVNDAGIWRSKWYEITVVFGAPRHEFRKIRNVYPNIGAVALGGGYTFQWNRPLLGHRGEIAPSDNSLGTAFSGVQTTADGSCRDVRSAINGYVASGATALPMSDCPETWGPIGFQGPREIPLEGYLALRDQLGNNFNWQYWSASGAQLAGPLGNFSTFGFMTDYTNEILQSYGSVTPLSTRAPAIDGYPLGLDMKFEAFTFALPSLANTVVYQMTVVNNSKNVYGTGIDYDSLYGGLEIGFYDRSQNANTYYEPGRNAVMSAVARIHPACNGTRRSGTDTPGCPGANVNPDQGFNDGAVGFVVLKSPLGDMRNKLLSRTSSPFYNPTSPSADDTITFNHGHKCGYTPCYLNNLSVNARRQFGLMSSTGENVLDGRSVNDLSGSDYFYTFRNWDYPVRSAKFNAFAPGLDAWDYDEDGQADTIFFDTCDETVNNTNNVERGRTPKCVSTWSDSTPGGFVNSYGNVFGMATAGPFALKAGDTTSFIWAFNAGPDSVSIEAITDNVIEAYLNFWAGPKPPAPTTIISAAVGQQASGAPQVELIFSNAPEVWVDTFLLKYADDLENSTAPAQTILRELNPGLADQIRARAAAGMNFSALYIYRSCNGGASWDANGDCIGDPSLNLQGQTIGNGWRPYHIVRANANGQIPNVFLDGNVTSGRTYLYSLITQSRGFRTTVLDSVDGALVSRELVVVDSLLSPVPTSGPNVRSVYVPISFAAGTTPASFVLEPGTAQATIPVNVRLGATAQAGVYTATYADRFIVIDSLFKNGDSTKTAVIMQRYFANAVNAAGDSIPNGSAVTFGDTLRGRGPIGIGGFDLDPDTVVNTATLRVTVDTLTGLSFVLSRNGAPLFISRNATAAETTPTSFLGSPLFPGFQITIDPTTIGAYQAAQEITIKPVNDTIPQGIVNTFGVNWAETQSTRRNSAVGKYEFLYQSDPFGAGAPFTLNLGNGAAVEQAVQQSLAGRADATIGDTTAATLALVRAATGNNSIRLVPGRFPFTVRNETFGRDVRLAMISRTSIGRTNTIVLGDAADTLRIAVDSLEWVPGDQFAMLETVTRDSTIDGAVVINAATGLPIQVQSTIVTFAPAVLACTSPRASCNPLALNTTGSTGYLTLPAGSIHTITYQAGFRTGDQFVINVTGRQVSSAFNGTERARIRVVPNPYVAQSVYDQVTGRVGTSRVYFSHVPTDGVLRIYSVSGQLLQQLRWTAADLNGTGDLPYDLRTREGTDLASGLYIWTIQATSATSGGNKLARGKFVVVR